MRELLGRPRVHPEHANEENEIGVATGMYYTPMGGDIMFVEAAIRRLHGCAALDDDDDEKVQVSGWGNVSLILTGQLGDVMKESGARRADLRRDARLDAQDPRGPPRLDRGARARAGGRDPEGRAERRRGDVDRAGERDVGPPGAPRRRDDRRDHAARPRAADRRA